MCDPNATWWVDTGKDRAAGALGVNPGSERPWPLHGTMRVDEKFDHIKSHAGDLFPTGVALKIASGSFADDTVAILEGEGFGYSKHRRVYNNRYAFVFEVHDGTITAIREYMDTLHAQDIFGYDRASNSTVAQTETPEIATIRNDTEELMARAWMAFSCSDIDAFSSCFSESATWWTDSGVERVRGRFDLQHTAADGTPFHGVVPINEKVDYIRQRMGSSYSGVAINVMPFRFISGKGRVATEAVGNAVLSNGRIYQNRYLLIADIVNSRISKLREYCDTLHVADVTGA